MLVDDKTKKDYEEGLLYDLHDFVDDYYEDSILLNRLSIYQPSGYENDKKLHVLISYESESVKEDSFFNSLKDFQPSRNYEIDWNPIEINKSGTIEEYLINIAEDLDLNNKKDPIVYRDLSPKQQAAVLRNIGTYTADELPYIEDGHEYLKLVHEHFKDSSIEISPVYLKRITETKTKIDNYVENLILTVGEDIFVQDINDKNKRKYFEVLKKQLQDSNKPDKNIEKLLAVNNLKIEKVNSFHQIVKDKNTNKELYNVSNDELLTVLIDKTVEKINTLKTQNKRKDFTISEYQNRDKTFQENLEKLENYAKKMKICGDAQQKIYETFESIQNKNPITKNILMMSKVFTQLKPKDQQEIETLVIDKVNEVQRENQNKNYNVNTRTKTKTR